MLLFLLVMFVIFFATLGIIVARKKSKAFNEVLVMSWVCGIVLAIAIAISTPTVMISNYDRAQELITFYETNVENYSTTVTKTQTMLSTEKLIESALIEGSIEKLQLANQIAIRITEWRNAVNEYNYTLQKFRYWKSNIWLGIYFPKLPESLRPLKIE